MKARIGGHAVEVPEDRVRGGQGMPTKKSDGSYPAPSPPGWPKPSVTFTFTLDGQIPGGKNQVRTAWTLDKKRPGKMKPHKYPDKRFEAWRSVAVNQICMALGMDREAITGPVSLIVDYVPGDLIKRDVDGMLSALFHVLVKAGLLVDDSQVKHVNWHEWPLDRQHPKCRVVIEEV